MSELKHSMFTSVLYETAYHYRAITNTQVTPRLFHPSSPFYPFPYTQLIVSPHHCLHCYSPPYLASLA
jgi:hypothetical protein